MGINLIHNFLKLASIPARPWHWCREKRNGHDQHRPFITSFSAKDIRILRASYRANRIQTSAGERPPPISRLIIYRKSLPLLNGHIDGTMIGRSFGIEAELTAELKKQLRPGLDAIIRWLSAASAVEEQQSPKARSEKWRRQEGSLRTLNQKAATRGGRRPTARLPGLHLRRVGLHQNRSVLFRNRFSKQQRNQRAFRMHWSIIYVGSETPIGSSTALLFFERDIRRQDAAIMDPWASVCPDLLRVP